MKLNWSLIVFSCIVIASDQIPAPNQDHPIIFSGATIHTVSHGVLENAEILFDGGKIISVGHNLSAMYNIERIDATGKHIFPGLISAVSTLGLQEIGAVRATRDYAEVGRINPNVRANVSYNPDSELIPISRSNGILLALSVPRSGRISGTSSLMMLDGWTWEDATLKHPVGLHLFWPSMKVPKKDKEKEDKTDKDAHLKSIQKIDDLIQESRAYLKLKETESASFNHDLRLEGMLPILTGDIPVFIHANEVRQIEAAVYWTDRQNLEMVLVGGKDSWRTTTLLKERDIPVIYTQTYSTPMRRFENYDQAFTTPLELFKAGVKFCIFALKILSTAISPSVTGDLSALIVIFTPRRLISLAIFPASKNVSRRFSAVSFRFKLLNFFNSFQNNCFTIYNFLSSIFKIYCYFIVDYRLNLTCSPILIIRANNKITRCII